MVIEVNVHNSELGNLARVVAYTHESLRVERRHDLECEKVSAIWLECGLPQEKRHSFVWLTGNVSFLLRQMINQQQ